MAPTEVLDAIEKKNEDQIRTRPRPNCYLCGSKGNFLYMGLRDRLFGTQGEWNLKKCSNPSCQLVWLDPMPMEDDIGKAYETYYTHSKPKQSHDLIHRLYWAARDGYLRKNFGYTQGVGPRWYKYLSPIAYLHPAGRAEIENSAMYLQVPQPGARLLEVGCGYGIMVARMQEMGWTVTGVDNDTEAVYLGQQLGLPVYHGNLMEQGYPDNHFDAVCMSHVIEHVYNPGSLLKECFRVLKPGGKMVIVTPNCESFTHKKFTRDWLHLDPPRHLYLFNKRNLGNTIEAADFSVEQLSATARAGYGSYVVSWQLSNGRQRVRDSKRGIKLRFQGILYQYQMRALVSLLPQGGEEILLIARKQ